MAAETEKVEPGDSEQDEEEDVYEVERIIDMRVEGGDVLYRVRWKNYCSDDDTWEPEAHLEDCREVLLAYKRSLAEAKAKKDKEAEAKKSMLPTKSDLFDADSGSDSDKDRPRDVVVKKKKKKKKLRDSEEDEPPLKEKRKKKKDKRKEDMVRPRPAPETDEGEEEEDEEEEEEEKKEMETAAPTPPSPPREKKTEPKKRVVDSDEEDNEPVPKKHKKDKGKEGGKHRRERAEEGKKKKGKKERKIESTDDEEEEEEAAAPPPPEDDLTDGLSESQTDDAAAPESASVSSEKAARPDDKSKPKKGKAELKLKGIKDFIQDKKGKKPDFPSPSQKESSLQKLKSLTSKSREDTAPHSSDSSDSSTLHKKAKSKGPESATPAPAKVPFSSASSSSSSSSVTAARSNKPKEEEPKEEVAGPKDAAGSTSFGRFLLDFETKDRARKHAVHQPTAAENAKSTKLVGRIEKRTKPTKEPPSQKSEPEKTEKTKTPDAARPGQSYGFNLDSDEKEGEEPSTRPRFGEDTRDRRDRPDEAQRSTWDRRTPTDDRRRRREDSEPRLFMACEDNLDTQDPLDSTDKSDKGGQATLSLGMDLNLDWMTLEDFQKHLNGEDEILSGPPLSPSELRDAVKSGDYMSVKLALNSKEDYNLDQEACAIDGKRSVEEEKSLIEDRSSSDQFRLGFNTDMENIPRDFDGPADNENIPKEFDSVDAEEVALREDETVLRSGRLSPNEHSRESNATGLDGEQQSPEQEGRIPGGGSPIGLDLHFHQEGSSNDAEPFLREEGKSPVSEEERMDVEQSRVEEANGSSDEAEGLEGSESNGTGFNTPSAENDGVTGKAAEVNSKEPAKARVPRRKKPGEGKPPTRSSSRTSKKVLVTTSSTMDDEEEILSNKHYCLYCKAAYTHLVKHLERKHSDETDVAHAIHFPKGSKIRQTLLDQIRSKGDYQHNCEVLKNGGEMAAKKQPIDSIVSVRDYLPCQHCFAFYRKTELWKHERSCKVKKGEQKPIDPTRCRVQSAAARLLPTTEFFTGGCDEIIDIMHQDDISRHVRNDPLICKYGHALSAKHDHDKSQFAYIAQKMRELGRFVLAVNELDSTIQYLHEICIPSRFELAVSGAKKVSGFDPDSSKFKTVSLVSKIGYSLKRAAEIAFGESRMTEDFETESNVQKFIHLLDTDWNGRFSRRALVSANRKQDIKKVEMDKSTLAEDLIKLHRFLKKEGDEATKELKESPNQSTWRKLSEATLTEVCLFNRGRVGNMGRMLLETYNSRKSKSTFVLSADQIMKSTKLELELGDQFTRLELEGQCGRNMLVLLTERMVSSIDLLISSREQAGVQNDNPYVFARSEGSSYIRGSNCFRRAAHDCEAKNSETLLASVVREQVASYWQLMSLTEVELDLVGKLVGLSKEECSKLSENPLQLEEVTKQLLKMERTLNTDALQPTADGAVPAVNASKKKAWSDEEQAAVKRYLGNFITLMKVPGKKECNACISTEPALLGRSWTDVKSYVHNTLQSVRRKYHQRKSEGDVVFLKRPREDQTRKTELVGDKTSIASMMAMQPNDYKDESTTIPITTPFPQMSPMVSPYSRMLSVNTHMAPTSRRMIPTFTPLNASDTMMAPTFRSPNARSPSMIPTFTPLNAPSPPMVSTFTPLNARSTMVSSFTPLNHPSTSMVSTFTPMSHSTLAYQTNAHMVPTSPRGGPTSPPMMLNRAPTSPHVGPVSPPVGQDRVPSSSHIGAPMVPDRTPVVPTSSPKKPAKAQTSPVKAEKRTKRLWSEEEQGAVRRQLGDLCKLAKAPGKKECDACLAAEPALRSRTWREVKYYVHNTIQSMKKRGTAPTPKRIGGRAQESHSSGMDWDAPVYLSL